MTMDFMKSLTVSELSLLLTWKESPFYSVFEKIHEELKRECVEIVRHTDPAKAEVSMIAMRAELEVWDYVMSFDKTAKTVKGFRQKIADKKK